MICLSGRIVYLRPTIPQIPTAYQVGIWATSPPSWPWSRLIDGQPADKQSNVLLFYQNWPISSPLYYR